jgi:hypothetical protein
MVPTNYTIQLYGGLLTSEWKPYLHNSGRGLEEIESKRTTCFYFGVLHPVAPTLSRLLEEPFNTSIFCKTFFETIALSENVASSYK